MSAIVCSAVATELAEGVFMTITPRWVAAVTSMLSTPMPARPMILRSEAAFEHRIGHLGGGTDDQGVVVVDGGDQFVGGEPGLDVALGVVGCFQDVDPVRPDVVGNQNSEHTGRVQRALLSLLVPSRVRPSLVPCPSSFADGLTGGRWRIA